MKRILLVIFFCSIGICIFAQDLLAGGSIKTELLTAVPEWGSGMKDLRSGAEISGVLYFAFEPSDTVRARAELSYRYASGYAHPLGRYESSGLPPVVDQDLIPGSDFRQELSVAQIWAEVTRGDMFIRAGKFPVGWGTCWFLNPTDVSAAQNGLDAFGDETVVGIPGVSLEWVPKDYLGFDSYFMFSDASETGTVALEDGNLMNLPFGTKVRYIADNFEASAGCAKKVAKTDAGGWNRTYYAVVDTVVSAGDAVVTAEAALSLPFDDGGTSRDPDAWHPDKSIEAGAGIKCWIDPVSMDVIAEYYYFGNGQSAGEYDPEPVLSGEKMLLGKHYAVVRGSREFTADLTAAASTIVNAADRSGLFVLEAGWKPAEDSSLDMTCVIPWGDGESEMGGERTLIPGVLDWRIWDSMTVSCMFSVFF